MHPRLLLCSVTKISCLLFNCIVTIYSFVYVYFWMFSHLWAREGVVNSEYMVSSLDEFPTHKIYPLYGLLHLGLCLFWSSFFLNSLFS